MRGWTVAVVLLLGAGCLAPASPGAPPVASFEIRALNEALTRWSFNASRSSGDLVEYQWNLGEGDEPLGPTVEKTFRARDLLYNITLIVTDAHGRRAVAVRPLQVGQYRNSPPEIEIAPSPRWVQPGQGVRLDASGTHDGDRDALRIEWRLAPWPPRIASWPRLDLAPGESQTVTMEGPGTYVYGCDRHPWMQGLLVASSVSESSSVELRNFAARPALANVSRDAAVRFHNDDPVAHNLSLRLHVPGERVGQGPRLELHDLAAGDHQAWLFAMDSKGAWTVAARGVRVSPDAPRIAWTNVSSEDRRLARDGPWRLEIGPVPFRTPVQARFTYESSPLLSPKPIVRILNAAGGQDASKSCTASPCDLFSVLYPGTYAFEVDLTEGMVERWSLGAHFRMLTEPSFGTVSSGDGHDHEH